MSDALQGVLIVAAVVSMVSLITIASMVTSIHAVLLRIANAVEAMRINQR